MPGSLIDNAIQANVERTVEMLRQCQPILSAVVEQGKCAVIGACYDLETGPVKFYV